MNRKRIVGLYFGVLLLALSTGCASTRSADEVSDPLEGVNRGIMTANLFVDDYAIGPVARGYKFITPQFFRTGVTNFFYNVDFPDRLVSSVGQAEGKKAATEVARFAVNTTVGVAGLFDPATHFGLGKYDEDLGQMFGRWGIPAGPYLVLPIMGPSNVRDTAGLAAEVALSPFFWLDFFETDFVSLGTGVFSGLNQRAEFDEQLTSARKTALDFYVFTRDVYSKRRVAQIADEKLADEDASDDAPGLYDDSVYDDSVYDVDEASPEDEGESDGEGGAADEESLDESAP